MEQRLVTPRWEDDPVRKQDIIWWRGCLGRRGLPPPRKDIGRQKERADQVKNSYVTISDGA